MSFTHASFLNHLYHNNACEVSWGPLIRQWLQHDPVLPAVAKQHPPPTSHSVSLDNLGNTAVSSLAQRKLINFSHSLPLSEKRGKKLSLQFLWMREREEQKQDEIQRECQCSCFLDNWISQLCQLKSIMRLISKLTKRWFRYYSWSRVSPWRDTKETLKRH